MEVTKAYFATMCGVSRAAIGKNKNLIVNSAGYLDTDNPVNKAYYEKHHKKSNLFTAPEESSARKTETKTGGIVLSSNETTPASTMLNMTIGELVEKFGNLPSVERYIKMQKDLVVTAEKEQRLEERRLIQIPKDFVTTVVFGLLETLMQRLLDIPDRISDQFIAYVQSDATAARQQIINDLSENITMSINDTKHQITNKIESMKNKYNKEDLIQDAVAEALEKE